MSEDGSQIFSAGADGLLVQWNWQNEQDGHVVMQTDKALYSVYLDELNQTIYAGDQLGTVYQLDLSEKKMVSSKKRHQGGVFGFLHANSVYSFAEDGHIKNGDQSYHLSNSSLRCGLQLENQYIMGSSDHHIRILNKDFLVHKSWKAHNNSVFGLAYLGHDILASAGRDARIKLWDLKSYRELMSVDAHLYQVTSLAYRNGLLLSSSMDKSLRIWSDELDLLKVADPIRDNGHSNCVNRVCWLNDSMFVSSSDDRSLIIWEIEKIG